MSQCKGGGCVPSERDTAFSRRLKAALKASKMRQRDLAAASGVPKGTIAAYTANVALPGAVNVEAICRALGVSSDWLLGLSDDPRAVDPRAAGGVPVEVMICEGIRDAADGAGVSLLAVSEGAGLHGNSVVNYATGRSVPTARSLVALALALGTSTDYLLGISYDASSRRFAPCA